MGISVNTRLSINLLLHLSKHILEVFCLLKYKAYNLLKAANVEEEQVASVFSAEGQANQETSMEEAASKICFTLASCSFLA
jgi:hypothetical protein